MKKSKTYSQLKRERGLIDTKDYRPTASARGYNSRWNRARTAYLHENPLCVACMKEGRTEPATTVDHIKPHKGDSELFWDVNNWQPLCTTCHNQKTAREDGGFGHTKG